MTLQNHCRLHSDFFTLTFFAHLAVGLVWAHRSAMTEEEQVLVVKSEEEPSLLDLIQQWLERTPGLTTGFWTALQRNVEQDLTARRQACVALPDSQPEKAELLHECENQEATFRSIFDRTEHEKLMAAGQRRLSYEATIGAIIISFHRDEPLFNLPYKVLECLIGIDQGLMQWRRKSRAGMYPVPAARLINFLLFGVRCTLPPLALVHLGHR